MKLHAQAPRLHIEDPFLLERPSFFRVGPAPSFRDEVRELGFRV